MKNILILFATIVLFASCKTRPKTTVEKAVETYKVNVEQVTTTETASGWQLYESKTGGYKIAFPKTPVEGQIILDSEIGKLDVYMASHTADETLYMSIYMDYPDSLINSETIDLKVFYTSVLEEAAANVNGKILGIKNITLNGIEGREVKISAANQDMVSVTRVFLVANRRYMFQMVGDEGVEDDELTKRFMDSFEFIE